MLLLHTDGPVLCCATVLGRSELGAGWLAGWAQSLYLRRRTMPMGCIAIGGMPARRSAVCGATYYYQPVRCLELPRLREGGPVARQ